MKRFTRGAMNGHRLIACCCTLIVIYCFQEVSGYDERTSQCTIQCHERCKKIQKVKNTRLGSCEKKCAKLSKLCVNCRGPRRCDKCAPGYKLSAFRRCTDKNECLWNNGGCSANALCINVIGGRVCVCKPGYFGNGKNCTDVNECTTGPFPCNSSVTATCINTIGSFMCQCKTGYDGNGIIGCQDINECTTGTFPCFSVASATCTNSPGSFKCACKAGYRGDGITSCNDVCTSGFFPCYSEASATCTSSSDSFSCACKNGFRGDGITSCPDVDECTADPFPCASAASATCTNTLGSFECKCKEGYDGDGYTLCEDINECTTGSFPCYDTATATCSNSAGSYSCACKTGYYGDGVTSCEDVDECATILFPCYNAESATCTNTQGSYKCACASGFYGDGVTYCTDQSLDPVLKYTIPVDGVVISLTVKSGYLYVANNGKISVFDATSFQFIRTITIAGSSGGLYGMVVSLNNDFLFVSDYATNRVYKVDLSSGAFTVIPANIGPGGIIINQQKNLLIAGEFGKILEYTTDGGFVGETAFANSMNDIAELSDGSLAVVCYGPLHGVAVISRSGDLQYEYGSTAGSGPGQMSDPYSMTLNSEGYFLVGDRLNSRVLVLNPALTEARTLSLPNVPTEPVGMWLDESRGVLFVGDLSAPRVRVYVNVYNLPSAFAT